MSHSKDPEKRLWAKVKRAGPDECWPWQGRLNRKGYGQIAINCVVYGPHRLVWELTRGRSLPPRYCISHSCGNKTCCNPRHMSVYYLRGSGHPGSKLTEDQVMEIHKLSQDGYSYRELGLKFNVSKRTIGNIVVGKTWKHIR